MYMYMYVGYYIVCVHVYIHIMPFTIMFRVSIILLVLYELVTFSTSQPR